MLRLTRFGRRIVVYAISFLALFELFSLVKWRSYRQEQIIDGDPDLDPDHPNVPYTDLSESLSFEGKDFWESHKPSYKCPSSLQVRVGGNTRDGGKWTCGLQTLGKRTVQGYNCTVYSFGVNDDSSFEAEVLETTQCNIFAFDPTVKHIAKPIKQINPRIQFQSVGLAGSDGLTNKTLKTLMYERGHKFIDILKIDVDGAEYNSLKRMMEDFSELPFGQLLIEFHIYVENMSASTKEQLLTFIRGLEIRGSRVFSIEPNKFAPSCCSEFSFINLKYLDLFYP